MEQSDQQINYNISFGMIYILLATVSNQPTEKLFIELSQRFQKRLNLSDEDAENALVVIQDLFYTLDDPEIFEGALNRAIEDIAQQSSAFGGGDFLKQVYHDLIKLSLADAEISFEEQLLLDQVGTNYHKVLMLLISLIGLLIHYLIQFEFKSLLDRLFSIDKFNLGKN